MDTLKELVQIRVAIGKLTKNNQFLLGFVPDDDKSSYYKFACYLIKIYSKQIIDIC